MIAPGGDGSASNGTSPIQLKVPVGRYAQRRRRRRGNNLQNANKKSVQEPGAAAMATALPVARLSPQPPSKAVAPYIPRSESEDTHLRFLIYHYVTVVNMRTLTCVGPRFEWYPLAVRDEAFFHVLMSSTSSHAAYLQKTELPRNFFYHRGIAIQLLNERIARGAHDEGTINTICLFAQQEAFEGRPRTAKTHIEGLLQLVRAAGGIKSVELPEKTRRHIFFTDLAAAITLSTKPILRPLLDILDFPTHFGRPSEATASYAKTFGMRLYNFSNSPLSNQAATVMWGLRNLSQLAEDFHQGKAVLDTALASDMQFTDRVEVLERLVHDLWYAENQATPQHTLFRTFGWTCLIYIYTILRELPRELGMNAMLAGRIKLALESCSELNVLLATFQDLLLWQMFVCGRVADERDRPFFASQATKILLVRKLENADEILVAAQEFIWPERRVSMESPSNSTESSGRADSAIMDVGE
ncbi:Uncharacterized protein BP5553_03660 [Venustampulla echinocandica]|uniref:Transcription factor domain-containing protein n=1 Tax=Venustampulla echinocandica TaxID=2656787 RepID=A0A370TUZ5_9HELO|nr:Uncharacterized protein BP5553_03660 [Venustampulla echinocandica]RDL39320.1 Uncharacterized protein BP5553_03660 [Venustampulla echinocandica]